MAENGWAAEIQLGTMEMTSVQALHWLGTGGGMQNWNSVGLQFFFLVTFALVKPLYVSLSCFLFGEWR